MRLEEALKSIKNVHKINKTEVQDLEQKLNDLIEQKKLEAFQRKYSMLDLFKTPKFRYRTIATSAIWLFLAFVLYGLSLNVSVFGKDPFLTFVAFQSSYIPGCIICFFTIKHFGCKVTILLALSGGIVILLGASFVADRTSHTYLGLLVAAKILIGIVFSCMYTYTGEMFPTVVRSSAMALCIMFGRLAAMSSPYVKEMEEATSLTAVTYFFIANLVACFAIMIFMPNTHKEDLQETLNNIEDDESEYTSI